MSGYYNFILAEDGSWDWSTVVCVLLNITNIISQLPPYASVLGLCLPMRPFRYAQAHRRRTFQTLNVCLVTKGTNLKVSGAYYLLCYILLKLKELTGFVNMWSYRRFLTPHESGEV